MDKFNPKRSKKAGLSKAVVPSVKGIGSTPTNDKMVQQRNIHRGCCLPELPRQLYIRSAWRWISAGVVVWVITYKSE